MQAGLRAQRERWEPRGTTHGLRCALVHGDVALGHTLRISRAHATEECADGKMATLHAVIEPGEEREVFLMRLKGFDVRRHGVTRPRVLGKKRRRVKAEHVADAHHPHRTLSARRLAGQSADRRVLRKDPRAEGFQ